MLIYNINTIFCIDFLIELWRGIMVSPIVAAIISLFLPGIGQVVQGETQKGIIMFVAAIVISIILTYALGTIGNIIYLIYAVYAAYDAYNMG